jgi:hypothetical protein
MLLGERRDECLRNLLNRTRLQKALSKARGRTNRMTSREELRGDP